MEKGNDAKVEADAELRSRTSVKLAMGKPLRRNNVYNPEIN